MQIQKKKNDKKRENIVKEGPKWQSLPRPLPKTNRIGSVSPEKPKLPYLPLPPVIGNKLL